MTEPENGAKQTTILLVDDDRDLAAVLGEFLGREGHRVVAAHTGRDARAALQATPFTLLLVDLRLPDVEGVELMKEAFRLPNPPEVVIITGNATVESAVAAVEAGSQSRCSSRRAAVARAFPDAMADSHLSFCAARPPSVMPRPPSTTVAKKGPG